MSKIKGFDITKSKHKNGSSIITFHKDEDGKYPLWSAVESYFKKKRYRK